MAEPLFTLLLALAWFGAFNVALSLLAAVFARSFDPARLADRPARSVSILFALKLAPSVISLFFTLGVFLPAHWRWEPARVHETAGYSIAVFAFCGAAIVAATAARAARETVATAVLVRRWRTAARQRRCDAAPGLRVFSLADRSPVMSLVGIVRPVLFVADEIEAELTPEEIDVSLAHEVAHARAGDNLKRLIAAWSPDALGIGPGRSLAARWRAAMEFAADEDAVRGSDDRAVALASALVKVARLSAPERPVPIGISRIHHQALLAARVERLLRPAGAAPVARRMPPALLLAVSAGVMLAAIVATHHPLLAVHQATEGLIRLLP